ncbi:DUF2285 domain-containing protein [Bradyrhizobium sp. CCGB12]|uniref:DUF2285 domain-containing protein n=1 Tax=Bradyrhizobium sp. CCGB12 TaxID=2949632 RepID=UPI0020B2C08B|nr:DUF2285 domain-containing protein [Bradyrhizobium sp. CCGB12]MCP3392200.1 DUF2285 domain-containing protein [Bradyrhizobium sp. CCGB12]
MNDPARWRIISGSSGDCLFAADPQKTFDQQAIFWAPEVLATVLPVRAAVRSPACYDLDLRKLAGSELRHAPDGWHAIVALGGEKHRLWLTELPPSSSSLALDLPFDRNFEVRLRAAHRFWLALERRPLGPPALALPISSRHQLILAMRAVDGSVEGHSYREIAQGLFGKHRIPDRGWKTHDLRSRTIRLVKSGLRLMRGGYRTLLRRNRKGRGDTT